MNPLEQRSLSDRLRDVEDKELDTVARQNIEKNYTENPDMKAEVLQMHQDTGIPQGTIERNFEYLKQKKAVESIDWTKVFDDAPEARVWAADPDNAALIGDELSDDFSFFGRVKKTVNDIDDAWEGGQELDNLVHLRNLDMFGQLTPEQRAQMIALSDSVSTSRYGTGGFMSGAVLEGVRSSPLMLRQTSEMLKGFLSYGMVGAGTAAIAGQVGPQVALPEEILTVPGAFIGVGTVGAISEGAMESFRQQSALTFDDLMRIKDDAGRGVDRDVALGASIIVGSVNAGLDLGGLSKVLEVIPGVNKVKERVIGMLTRDRIREAIKLPGMRAAFARIGKRFATGVTAEGLTEAGQELTTIMAEEFSKAASEGQFDGITATELVERVGEAGAVGTVAAGTITTPLAAGSLPFEMRRAGRHSPEEIAAHFENINNMVKESRLYQRSPERFNSLIRNLTGDQKLYINAEAAMGVVQNLNPDQLETLTAAMPDFTTELETAAASGADVSISKADYVSFIAPLEGASLIKDYIKIDPADISVAERNQYQNFLANNPELMDLRDQLVQDDLPTDPREMETAIERSVKKAMKAAGRSFKESSTVAPLFAKTMARFASALGRNAVDTFNQGLLRFETVNADGDAIAQGSNADVLLDDLEKVRKGERVAGLDGQGEAAVRSFGEKLDAAGISLEQAREMGARQVYDQLFRGQDNAQLPGESVTLEQQQMELPMADTMNVAMSAATQSIQGIADIASRASQGDQQAIADLNQIAMNALNFLTNSLPNVGIDYNSNVGLYGGYTEPSIGAAIEFTPENRDQVLAALAQFARNFNQEQIHVREVVSDPIGTEYGDGSYATPVYSISTGRALEAQEIEQLIEESGLYGLTFNDGFVEAYYVGDPRDETALADFEQAAERLINAIGSDTREIGYQTSRIWIYGEGSGAIPYEQIEGDVQTTAPGDDPTAKLIAERYLGDSVEPAYQQEITPDQAALQRQIAAEYEALPDNDMNNPVVAKAYEELAAEVIAQYQSLPIKVDAWDASKGEPYKTSQEMREDVQKNNHLWFYTTTPESFGPEGVSFDGHPLLAQTDFTTDNGHKMVVNDLLRVVHDYYAHGISATQFGAKGEEVAWKNHMKTIKSPWARWALTSETSGQNSWVNFNSAVYGMDIPAQDRPFARQKAALLPIEYSLTGDEKVDAPVQELIASLPDEEQNGSLSERADPADFTLQQRERGSITFSPADADNYAARLNEVVIRFTDRANLSTAAHEFSHWAVATHRYFQQLAADEIAKGNDTPELRRIIDDWETLKKQIGADDDVFTVEQEEKVASMFEAYLREGSAPSEGLRRIFTMFRDWLTKIYRDLTDLGVEMNEEVAGVFDRWLASESEIAQVKGKNESLAEIAGNLGLPESIVAKVAEYVNSSTAHAEEKLYRELTREQKSLQTKAYKEAFAKMRETVAQQKLQQREYSLMNYMRENGLKFLEGPETTGLPADIVTDQDVEGVIHPDILAELYGFDSGLKMLKTLQGTADFDRSVDVETRKRLKAQYPDMIEDGRIAVEAVDAIMNDRVVLALDMLIKEMGRSAMGGQPVSMKQFAKTMAQEQVSKMKMEAVNYTFRYDVARDKAMREALLASRAGDPQKAMLSLQRALVNQMIYKELTEFKKLREKAESLFKKLDQKDKKLAKSLDMDFIDAARHILSKFGLGGQRFNMDAWLQDIQMRDPDIMDDLVALSQVVVADEKPAKELTTKEFKDVYDAINNLIWVARRMKEFQLADQKYQTDVAVAELVEKLGEYGDKPSTEGTQVHGVAKFKSGLSHLKAMQRRVELWISSVDGGFGGPFRKFIWNPVAEAGALYRDERAIWRSKLNDILKQDKERLRQPGKIPSGMIKQDGRELIFRDRLELVGFLLHTGNASNLEKLLGGYGIAPESFAASIKAMEADGRIQKTDYALVQKLWDYAEDLKPISQKAHKQLYGYRFDEIEPMPLQTSFGVFRGGYWPAIVDREQVDVSKEVSAKEEQRYMLASTSKGFTKSRTKLYQKPLSTDLRLATQHIDQVLRFAYLEPAVRQVGRIINRPEFQEALKAQDTGAYSSMLLPWLQRSAQQQLSTPLTGGWAQVGKGARFLRTSTSAQTMMGNIANAVQNVTNFPIVIYRVGPRNFAKSFMQYHTNPMKHAAEVRQMSTMMMARQNVLDIDVTNEINEIVMRGSYYSKIKNAASRHGYIFQRVVQNWIDHITWMSAYSQYIEQGKEESEAVSYADSIVRETQSSAAPEDISAIEAGSELAKPFLMFYSYFNTIGNNVITESNNIIRDLGWKGTPRLFYMYMMMVAIPAVFGDLIVRAMRDDLPKDDDNDGEVLDDWLAFIGTSQGRFLAAMVPFAGQALNAAIARTNNNVYDDRLSTSPVVQNVERTISFVADQFSDREVDKSNQVRNALNTIGFVTGLPLGQLGKPAGFIANVQEGDEEVKGPGDVVRGVLGGPAPKR